MATEIYKTENVQTVDGKILEIVPLKIKYMRQFMDAFEAINEANNDDESLDVLCECIRISMQQFYPEISENKEQVADAFDLKTIYKILDLAGGIKINAKKEENVTDQAVENKEKSTWQELDLIKLETEAFLLGIWKNFDELETSISIPELMTIISTNRELDYEEKKFLAAMQGVDLDEQSGESKGQKEWEDMKARVFSRGATSDSNDVLSLQGQNAIKAGFGIGMGLDYEVIND